MKIIFLGYKDSPLVEYLIKDGNTVVVTNEVITTDFVKREDPGFIISYGYKHILREDILSLLPGRVVNLHISYLPFNRGADPNFWSFVEDTPKGVTIHIVDKGVDTGPILVQKKVTLLPKETLRTSYEKLQEELQDLFCENWSFIKTNKLEPVTQPEGGSFHKKKDLKKYQHILSGAGYDTPVIQFLSLIKEH